MSDRNLGVLYVVATPLGNLEDVSRRALRVLGEVDFIVAEDTRRTRKLLSSYGIPAPALLSCFVANEARRAAEIGKRLGRGEDGALVSDAGTPGISDPGARIVRAALGAGARVIPVPGPSALTAALSASGFPADRFFFQGFLPAGKQGRAAALRVAAEMEETVVLFESPRRVGPTLLELARRAPDRPVAVFRELTKRYEESHRGTLAEEDERVSGASTRGEYVIVLGPAAAPDQRATGADIREAMALRLREGGALAEAARDVARMLGVSRRAAYQAGLRLRDEGGES